MRVFSFIADEVATLSRPIQIPRRDVKFHGRQNIGNRNVWSIFLSHHGSQSSTMS